MSDWSHAQRVKLSADVMHRRAFDSTPQSGTPNIANNPVLLSDIPLRHIHVARRTMRIV